MTESISFLEDLLDIRNIIERFEELEAEKEALQEGISDGDNEEDRRTTQAELSEWHEEHGDEFNDLKKVIDDLQGNGGDEQWRGHWYPMTLINESHFTDYCEELVNDVEDFKIPSYVEIDWEATADNMKADYSSIDVGNNVYFYRS